MDANFGADGGNNDSPRGWDYISQPLDEANADPDNPEAFSFYVPLAHDPRTPGTLFTGGEYVWRTTDNGGDRAELDAHCRETTLAIGDSSRVCGDWVRIGRQISAGATSPRAPATTSSPSSARRRTPGRCGSAPARAICGSRTTRTRRRRPRCSSPRSRPVRSPVGSSRRSRSTRATPTTCGSPTRATRPTRRPRRATCSTCASTLPPAPAAQPTCPTISATSR